MNEDVNLSKLLRLKRYEQPPPGYFDDFLREFQRRQRAEALRRPAWAVLWDRIASIAPTFRVPQFAYAAILILAAGASTLIVTQQPAGTVARAEGSRTSLSLNLFEVRHNYRYASGLRTDRRVAALALCASVQAREQ